MSIRYRRADDDEWERQKEHPAAEPQRRSFRPRRRAVALAGLMLDIASLLALSAAVLAGVIPSGRMILPAVTLTLGITAGTAYLCITRSRP